MVAQIGLAPRRIDVLTEISGLSFADAWPRRVLRRIGSNEVGFLSREHLMRNKRTSGRDKDLADLESLGEP